ncbi:hypothetical protein Belba_0341 [Belliella baltica DSM 15883]|uniref:Uncharacterized protein n=1 Tax=Belliella baltica (strain DSM 15883 / CIP 108006 / LMG 21964 / BA134) TaxID=866536 RepID=I3Z186_BELBD|nr:hypothetical protein [Belliella baltica]AFL83004.1 hypothetical protein Belba_0341 [Belliella baltica DSM 15883]
MNYWLHRISHHPELSYPLLENGYLSIGFSDMINNEIIDKVLLDDWDYFNELFQMTWSSIPKTRFNLWNFLKMAKGDLVIVPSWGTFFVCQIKEERPVKIGDAFFDGLKTWQGMPVTRHEDRLISESGNTFDLGFAWSVNVLYKHIPRAKFADSKLTSRMKIRQTNANISDLKENIESSIKSWILWKEIS